MREWEAGTTQAETMKVEEACDAFTRDCEARQLSAASVGKYKLLTEELKCEFASRTVGSIDIQDVRAYRERWEMSPISARKKLERLRTFFKFCHESGWTRANPAKAIKPPVAKPSPTLTKTDMGGDIFKTPKDFASKTHSLQSLYAMPIVRAETPKALAY